MHIHPSIHPSIQGIQRINQYSSHLITLCKSSKVKWLMHHTQLISIGFNVLESWDVLVWHVSKNTWRKTSWLIQHHFTPPPSSLLHWPVNDNSAKSAPPSRVSLTGQWQFVKVHPPTDVDTYHWLVNDTFWNCHCPVCKGALLSRVSMQIVIDWSMTPTHPTLLFSSCHLIISNSRWSSDDNWYHIKRL